MNDETDPTWVIVMSQLWRLVLIVLVAPVGLVHLGHLDARLSGPEGQLPEIVLDAALAGAALGLIVSLIISATGSFLAERLPMLSGLVLIYLVIATGFAVMGG